MSIRLAEVTALLAGASMLKMGAVWGIKGWRDLLVLGFAEFILTLTP
jgi:hypothetical protein